MVQEDQTNWDLFFKNHPTASGFEGSTLMADGYLEGRAGVSGQWVEL